MAKETYMPGELQKLKRVKVFEPAESETSPLPVQRRVTKFADEVGGQVYTGIHKENDWSRTAWWERGWHLVNRTCKYAVVW